MAEGTVSPPESVSVPAAVRPPEKVAVPVNVVMPLNAALPATWTAPVSVVLPATLREPLKMPEVANNPLSCEATWFVARTKALTSSVLIFTIEKAIDRP